MVCCCIFLPKCDNYRAIEKEQKKNNTKNVNYKIYVHRYY